MERAKKVLEQISFQGKTQYEITFSPCSNQSVKAFTEEQCAFYQENGFIVIKNVLSAEEVDAFVIHFQKICSGEILPLAGTTIMRDITVNEKNERNVNKIQDWHDDEVLFNYCKHPTIVNYVSDIIGENIRSIHTMFIQKPGVVQSETTRHPLHQDLLYFPFRPADKIVCSWTCLEESINRENGGLVVLPGSHKQGKMYPHGYPSWDKVNKLYYGIQMDEKFNKYYDENKVYLDMKKGDTVFFHPLLIHGSGANKAGKSRKAMSCHYASTDCSAIFDLDGSIQADIANEVVELAKKLVPNIEFSFTELWLLKSRHVAGKNPGNFFLFSTDFFFRKSTNFTNRSW